MRSLPSALWVLLATLLLVGCTSTKVSNTEEFRGGKIPRPARIIVYDFAVTPEDLPSSPNSRYRSRQR